MKVIEELLDQVGDRGSALLLRGEPGIGKSALLGAAACQAGARGTTVLSAAGVQSETHLPFAGLHQLLWPMLDSVDELPAPQREALLSAFGVAETGPPEFFLIALAALNLLGEAAARRPLLVTIDDVQWLDIPTMDVLGFVARRVASEPVVLLMALLDPYATRPAVCGLPEMCLTGLDQAASEALLDARPTRLSPGLRRRVLAEAAGNPLALAELPLTADEEPLAANAKLLPLTVRLERAFAQRATDLPAVTQTLLLVAAADDGGKPADVLAATAAVTGMPATASALDPAVRAGLVEAGPLAVRFRHPLIRSAIYQMAGPGQRLAAHAALAETHAADPDRRAWHRAAASGRQDERVAAELEAVADRARARGAISVAVEALHRSGELSEDPALRGERLLRAAELAFELGGRDLAGELLGHVQPGDLGLVERARLTWLHEMLEEGPSEGAPRSRRLVELAARCEAEGAGSLALNFVRAAALRCWWSDPGPKTRLGVVAAAERLHVDGDDPELLMILASASPVERGATVIERLSKLHADADPMATRLLGMASTFVGAFDLATGFLTTAIAGLRAQGRLGLLAQTLVSHAYVSVRQTDWTAAMCAAEEAERLARETGQPRWAAAARVTMALLSGLRGEWDAAGSFAAEAERVLVPMASSADLALLQMARGVTALCAGQHAEAYGHLRRMFRVGDPAYHPVIRWWAVDDFAEAAAGAGHAEEARAALAELEKAAALTPSPLLHVGLRHAHAVLADSDTLYQAALDADLSRWPMARGRLLLAYGAWLRRRRRVVESRVPLRAAREVFDALGMPPWAERARQELRASGEAADRRDPAASDRLSAQELQIARLAADGLSNREIGQQLYLSHRTVGTHLYRIFPKLGITSRAQLREALDGQP
ncbi:LuxR family transcriptional regulator [Planotetraspora thailandica]|uniref:LuxR family transcriptional regulator n=2 Tax=Planotetraspora thailandica TaxID=487172 RepID=A0A8J3XV64_9ACTN|nr:LuxR family transcriptional regulator [Planotetraspora thailandica]